jgi:uncharacterized transporter YbjL
MVGLFTGFNILAAWSLYALLKLLFWKKKGSQDSWFMLGIFGGIFLCSLIVEYGTAWYSGYLEEQLTWSYRTNSLLLVFMVFEFIVGITTSLNIFKKIRENGRVRVAQLILIFVYLLGHIYFYGFSSFDYATSTIPGWHTTIYAIGNFWGLTAWLIVILTLGLMQGSKGVKVGKGKY